MTLEQLTRIEANRLPRAKATETHPRFGAVSETALSTIESMESEHASYASTKQILKRWLPTNGANHLKGIGDEAAAAAFAVINGKTIALTYSSESHNGPSYPGPHPGAATGAGGNERDDGAQTGRKPVVQLEARRQSHPRIPPFYDPIKRLAEETVKGIADYANAMGIPHGDGSIKHHPAFTGNILVNVMCAGLQHKNKLLSNKVPIADTPEHYVGIYVGKASDKTGVGGTKFASEALDMDNASLNEKAIQDPDPHLQETEMRALERVVEVASAQGWLHHVSFKDMGAAGLLCSTVEQLHSGIGFVLDGDRVPKSRDDLTSVELLEAETQERFFIYVHEDYADRVLEIFNEEYGLPSINVGAQAAIVGRCTSDGRYTFVHDGVVEVDLLAEELAEGPEFTKPVREPRREKKPLPETDLDWHDAIDTVLDGIHFKDDEVVYGHYDQHIGRRNIVKRGEGAAILMTDKMLENRFGFSMRLDSKVAVGLLDPSLQAEDAVVSAGYAMSLVGCSLIGLTNNANYGLTDNPEDLWAFEKGQEGLARACNNWRLEDAYLEEIRKDAEIDERIGDGEVYLTVNSGNCSMNKANANTGTAIPPTAIIGSVGWTDTPKRHATHTIKEEGELVLIGARQAALGGTEYAQEVFGHECVDGEAFSIDYNTAHREVEAIVTAVRAGFVTAGSNIEEGGLAAAVGKLSAGSQADLDINVDVHTRMADHELTIEEKLFSENHGVVLHVPNAYRAAFDTLMQERNVNTYAVGTVRNGAGTLSFGDKQLLQEDVRENYTTKLPRMLEGVA